MAIGTIPADLFVGRSQELEHLREALRLACEGSGRMDLLVGEPGIGKTRLADELCSHARKQGVRVLAGRCLEDAGMPAYWPWAQAVEPYLASLKPKELAARLGPEASLVATAFPAIRRLMPTLKPYSTDSDRPDEVRFRLFEVVTDLLVRAAAEQPVLLLLDDLHWADEGTLKLLVFVSRELARSHLMVLSTYRDVEVGRKHPLAGCWGSSRGSGTWSGTCSRGSLPPRWRTTAARCWARGRSRSLRGGCSPRPRGIRSS